MATGCMSASEAVHPSRVAFGRPYRSAYAFTVEELSATEPGLCASEATLMFMPSGALKSFSIMMLSRSSTSRPVQLSRLSGPHAHGDRSRTGPPLFELKADAPSSVHTQTASCSPMRGWQVLIAIPRPHRRPTAPWRSPLPQDLRGVVDLSGQLLHRSRGHVHRPLPARSLGSSEPGRVQ